MKSSMQTATLAIFLLALCHQSYAAEPSASLVETTKIWETTEEIKCADIAWHRDQWFCVVQTEAELQIIGSEDGKTWRKLSTPPCDKPKLLYDPRLSVTSDGRLMLNAVRQGIPCGGVSQSWFSFDGVKWKEPKPIAENHFLVSNVVWHVGVAYSFQRGSICGNASTIRIGVSNDHGKSFKNRYEDHNFFGAGKAALVFSQDQGYCVMSRLAKGNKRYGAIGVSKAPFWQWEWKKLTSDLSHPNATRTKNGAMIIAAGIPDDKGAMQTTLCRLNPDTLKLARLQTIPTSRPGFVGLAKRNEELFVCYHNLSDTGSTVHMAKVLVEE